MSLLRISALILSAGLLAACSSGPSEQDIQQVLENNYEQINQFGSVLGMQQKMISLTAVDKVGCQSVRDNVYRCDLVIESDNMLLGQQKETTSLLFMQTKAGWTLVDE